MRLSQLPWWFSENDHRSCNSQKISPSFGLYAQRYRWSLLLYHSAQAQPTDCQIAIQKGFFRGLLMEILKKAVRFLLEVGRWRKAPRHQLFLEFFAKAIEMSGQFVYGGEFQVLLSSHKIPQSIGKRWHSKSVCEQSRVRVRVWLPLPLLQCGHNKDVSGNGI